MIGQVIGSYRIISELGKGGMGMVYLAEHVQLGRRAALKMLLPALSTDTAIVQRFFNEAKAASAIDHPGIVEIYDFGRHTDGSAYIVMALLKGETLDARLKRGPMTPHDAATILAQVAGALAAAHARGIVHRDLKPDNLFLVPNELMPGGIQVKLLDFGIAKLADEQTAGVKTQTGALIGTPAYMSPEQCMGKSDLDHRTDLYALGCILFHMLCGRPPFLSDHGTGVLIVAHIRDAPPPPLTLNPHLPAPLVAIVMRLLEKEPAARFQTATELRAALVAAGANAPITRAGNEQYAATIAPSRYTGAEAYGATTAPTTRSGAASQQIIPPTTGGSKRNVWIGVSALLVALGAVGAFVAVRHDHAASPPAIATLVPPPAPPAPSAAPVPPTPTALVVPPTPPPAAGGAPPTPQAAGGAPPTPQAAGGAPPAPQAAGGAPPAPRAAIAPPAPTPQVALPDCPAGQALGDDTSGHCCWPDQAWSSVKDRCVGVPSCPAGMVARKDECAPQVKASTLPTTFAHGFRLNAKSYAAGDPIEIKFDAPISSTSADRAWVAVAPAGTPESTYGDWKYVDDHSSRAALTAPSKEGAFEIRLHTDYPTKKFHIVHAEPFEVKAAPVAPVAPAPVKVAPPQTPLSQQRFSLAETTVRGGDKLFVTFTTVLQPASGEQFWITIVKQGSPDSAWGSYQYVPAGAATMKLVAPIAGGDYEVRLHGNYPTKSTNVVHRVPFHVDAP